MPTPLDAEDALDLLGEDPPTQADDPEGPVSVEFPPMMAPPPRAGGAASSIAGGHAMESPRPATGIVSKPKADDGKDKAERERLEKLLKAAQDAEKKAQDAEKKAQERAKKLDEDVAALRKEMAASLRTQVDKGELERVKAELDKTRKELEEAHFEADRLRTQAAKQKGAGPGLPVDSDEGPIPKEGLLDQVPYGRILVRLMRDKFTGRLGLKAGTTKRDIFFEEGQPVAHHTSGPGEPLGRVLVAQGRITEEQYLAAARAMVERGAKLTEALLEMGAIDAERLQQEQRQFTREQIVGGFALTQGNYSLEAGKAAPDEVAHFEFRVGEIYLHGYRKHAPDAEVKASFARVKDMYVRGKDELAGFRPLLGLEQEDEKLLRTLGEAYTVEEAMERTGVDRDRAIRLIAALRMLGLIGPWQPGAAEFEARLKAERIHQQEEQLALKQKLREREEQLMADVGQRLERIEKLLSASGGVVKASVVAASPPAAHKEKEKEELSTPSLSAPAAAGTGRLKKPTITVAAPQASAPVVHAPPPPPPPEESAPPPPAEAAVTQPPAPAASGADDGPGHERYREGMRQAAAGRLDEAELALREAVRLDATKPAYLTALARVLLANPRYERGGTLPVVKSLLDRAKSIAPGDAEVDALLHRIQGEMG